MAEQEYKQQIVEAHYCKRRKLRPYCKLVCSMCMSSDSVDVILTPLEYEQENYKQTVLYLQWCDEMGVDPGTQPAPDWLYPILGI